MGLIDIAFLIILFAGLYYGYKKGLIKVVFSFASIIIGILAALAFAPALGIFLKNTFNTNAPIMGAVAFGLIIIGVALGMNLIAAALTKMLQIIQLNFINRIMGGILGVLLFAFTLSISLWVFEQVHELPKQKKRNIRLYTVIQPIAPSFIGAAERFLPGMEGIFDRIERVFEKDEEMEEGEEMLEARNEKQEMDNDEVISLPHF